MRFDLCIDSDYLFRADFSQTIGAPFEVEGETRARFGRWANFEKHESGAALQVGDELYKILFGPMQSGNQYWWTVDLALSDSVRFVRQLQRIGFRCTHGINPWFGFFNRGQRFHRRTLLELERQLA